MVKTNYDFFESFIGDFIKYDVFVSEEIKSSN